MLFKKFLGSFFILFSILSIIISASRIDALATSFTIQTNFLDVNAVWINKLGQVTDATTNPKTNTDIANSPYQVTMTSGHDDYTFLMSVGAYIPGTTDRVLFGAFSGTMTGYYNLSHASGLTPFASLTQTTRSAVIVLHEDLYYTKLTSMTFSYAYGSRDDVHDLTVIYSLDRGTSWHRLGNAQSFTTGSSAQSLNFSSLSLAYSTLRVGFLFENTFNYNNDAVNMSNPDVTLEITLMTDLEQAQQFASEIEDYSPCADEDNNMLQITPAKQIDFIDKYERLSAGAKGELSNIMIGDATALARYLFLIQ